MTLWQAEHTLDTSAEPGEVWRRMEDVGTWPDWEAGVTRAELAGPFLAGTLGRMTVAGEGTRSFRLAEVVDHRSFTALVRLPFAQIRHIHDQEPSGLGTKMTHRIEIAGPLAWLYAFTRGRKLREGLAPSLRSLARLASEAPGSN